MLNLMTTENFLNFGRYAQQTEQLIEDLEAKKESAPDDVWLMSSPSLTPPSLKVTQPVFSNNKNDEIPSLMSIQTPATSGLLNTRNGNGNGKQQFPAAISGNSIKENLELTGIQSRPPGPIQRPTKLAYQPFKNNLLSSASMADTPSTPDVLEQINRLIDHQESLTSNGTDTPIAPTPGVQWTSFSASEWHASTLNNHNSSWPSNSVIPTNPFAVIPARTSQSPLRFSSIDSDKTTPDEDENKRRTDDSLWSNVLSPSTSQSKIITGTVTKNDEKENNSNWLKFWQCSESEETTNNNIITVSTNGGTQSEETSIKNKDLWSPLEPINIDSLSGTIVNTHSELPPLPPGIRQTWWPIGSDKQQDQNNDKGDDDEVNKQSKWDFAR